MRKIAVAPALGAPFPDVPRVHSRIPQPTTPNVGEVFATSASTDVYHLLTADEKTTLCGMTFVPIIIDGDRKGSSLHLTSSQPKDRKRCEACARVNSEKAD